MLAEMLEVLDEVKDREAELRGLYGHIWKVGQVLFQKGQTRARARRAMRRLRAEWDKLRHEIKERAELFEGWCKLTDSLWSGLFHCYADPRIPATNNDTEQTINFLKELERRIARNPKPARRFVRNAPLNAVFLNASQLPGEDFIASRTIEELEQSKEFLRQRSRKNGIMQQARRDLPGTLQKLLHKWKAPRRRRSSCRSP